MKFHRRVVAAAAATGTVVALALTALPSALAGSGYAVPFINHFSKIRTIASTVPRNGDVNPYGVFVVRQTTGRLRAGNVLVSNFNNKANEQGRGSTIVQVSPSGQVTLFARIRARDLPGRCPGGVGLTTALVVLPGGWVVVGSTPSRNGSATTSRAGCLIILDRRGQVRKTIAGRGINGPWDATAVSTRRGADIFVTNVLNGTVAAGGRVVHRGTVVRLTMVMHRVGPPTVAAATTIASGYAEQLNTAAFVLGPTGVGLGRHDTLYVASTLTSRIFAVPRALTRPRSGGPGRVVTHLGKLNMPLGLAIAPNGNVLTVNGGDGRIVETTPAGMQVASRFLDRSGSPPGAGALFGLAVRPGLPSGVYFVDNATNTLRLLH